ncbi:MAG: VTT domain-containing protein [Candidatus Aenigmatarchaeota archaeon]
MVIFEILTWAHQFLIEFSYFGVFLLSLISTSTIFLPLPLYAITFVVTSLGLNPFIVGFASGLGSAIGELTGYFLGAGGRHVVEEKKKLPKWFRWLEKHFHRFGFLTILITALLPFPFDVVGILAGASNYNLKKFFLATFIGKTIKTILIAFSGYFGGTILIHYIEALIKSVF